MRCEFDIKITTKEMYQFLLSHTYRGMSGIVGVVAGIGLIAYYFLYGMNSDSRNPWVFLAFGILFLVYQPFTLYTQAAKQTKLNPVFKEPLHYVLTEQVLEVSQAAAANKIEWADVWSVRETRQSILIYTSDRNAFIWPKRQLGEQEREVRTLLRKMIDDKRMKLKKGM